MGLTQNAATFAQRLHQDTGLALPVIYGWITRETSGWNTTNGPNNWLNVGSFDSGFVGGGANVWDSPISAADATASFMAWRPIHGVSSPVGPSDPTIHDILSTVGQSMSAQIAAIQDSKWAKSHYEYDLASDVQPYVKRRLSIIKGGPAAPAVGNGPNGGRVRPGGAQDVSTRLDISNYLNAPDNRTAPKSTAEDTGFLSGAWNVFIAPLKFAIGQEKEGWKNLTHDLSAPVDAFVDAGKATEDVAGEAIKIMESLPWYALRFTEFIVGIILMGVGGYMAVRPSGSSGGLVHSLVEATPLGRVRRIRSATRLGRREGQAEHYRLAARREARATEASKVSRRQAKSLQTAGKAAGDSN